MPVANTATKAKVCFKEFCKNHGTFLLKFRP